MVGALLTAVVTGALWAFWGPAALVSGIVFGLLATAIQVAAVAAVKPVWAAPFDKFLGRWGLGMGLRVGGVVVFLSAVLVDRELFPPVPSALGYLGVLIPLLFAELRFVK
jgi:hypothetical protein